MDDHSEKIALEIQTRLLQNFITLVRSSDEQEMLHITLQKTVDLAAEITGAETGSLFLLSGDGVVTDCLMMRETQSHEDSVKLIGTILDRGLAGWVVKNRKVGLVTDTRQDSRWLELSDQPYRVRSAIVTPILKGKTLFGILSLVHSEPRQFNDNTAELLLATADHIAIVLENAKLYQSLNEAFHKIEHANKKIEAYSSALRVELEKGRHMQRTFLPKKLPEIPGWQIDACFHPAKQVSGDFYDLFPIGNNHLGIVIADVCDKGVSAALFMGIFRSLIHAYLENAFEVRHAVETPGQGKGEKKALAEQSLSALLFLNNYIERHHGREGIFATLFFGLLHIRNGNLRYINAGHEPLMLVDRKGETQDLNPTGPAIGIMPSARFEIASVDLKDGETLIGFTDGITEAFSGDGVDFGRDGILAAMAQLEPANTTLMDAILHAVFDHLAGSELTDDIAMISIRRTAGN